jgi:hypothetical protein
MLKITAMAAGSKMVKTVKIWFMVGVLVAMAASAYAQATFSILPPGISMLPSYANANTTTSFAYALQYNGTTPFTGDLYTYADVNGVTVLPALDTITVSGLAPGAILLDTVQNFNLSANPGPFVNGRNGIVIWVADDNFSAISDSSAADILVACGPAFRLFNNMSAGVPSNGTMGCVHEFDIDVVNINEVCYKDTLFLHVEANRSRQYDLATSDTVQLPFSISTSVRIRDFVLRPDIFQEGWNDLRIWASGHNGCFAVDSLSLQIFISSSTESLDRTGLHVAVWPNPSTQWLHLEGNAPGGTRLTLYDGLGCRRDLGRWRDQIDLGALHLPQGTYTLFIQAPGKLPLCIPIAYLP